MDTQAEIQQIKIGTYTYTFSTFLHQRNPPDRLQVFGIWNKN